MRSAFSHTAARTDKPFEMGGSWGGRRGFTLVEVLITMAIFLILMSVAFSVYLTQLRTATREYAVAGSEMDLLVTRNIIVRDLEMGGFGLADDYSGMAPAPPNIPFVGSNGTPDTLVIRGTALGLNTRSTQGWSYVAAANNFPRWNDASEDLNFDSDDASKNASVVLLEPATRRLQTFTSGVTTYWRFRYNVDTLVNPWTYSLTTIPGGIVATIPTGTLIYGLVHANYTDPVTQPYWAVGYHIAAGSNPEDRCAPDAKRLLRIESLGNTAPLSGGEAVASCVLDFQVAFGLDRDEDGSIDAVWDNGGTELAASSWTIAQIKKRLKQVRVYILVQSGKLDTGGYTYPSGTVRVGDAVAGRDFALSPDQRKYRWKVLTVSVTPRNMR